MDLSWRPDTSEVESFLIAENQTHIAYLLLPRVAIRIEIWKVNSSAKKITGVHFDNIAYKACYMLWLRPTHWAVQTITKINVMFLALVLFHLHCRPEVCKRRECQVQWTVEIKHFNICAGKYSNVENLWWVSRTILHLAGFSMSRCDLSMVNKKHKTVMQGLSQAEKTGSLKIHALEECQCYKTWKANYGIKKRSLAYLLLIHKRTYLRKK